VRLENMVVNRQAILAESDAFLCFETLTLCPIELRCVDETLLSREEIRWLDRYHAQVRDTLFPTLSDRGKTWLLSKTVPLEGGGP
ncbi:MAG: M24 family metallopeptidase C-terminal domain-containing protein, partial [Burkholderiaceae bacterium]|jgi:Xaa-Pro aminopeptidase|nr:M24 family metallopeptidase C-terminal domain-containing protein [Burkholderiaceae bacterium]